MLAYLGFLLFSYIVFRVVVRRDYLLKGRLSVFSVALEFLVFALHANLSYLYIPADWPNLPSLATRPLLNAIAFFLVIVGLGGVFAAMASLGFRATMGQRDRFHREGLYRWSRNPQIVAYSLVVIGFALLWPSYEAILWVVAYGIVAHLMVRTEEEYLVKAYGSEYLSYCEEVPRYIPVLRKSRSASA